MWKKVLGWFLILGGIFAGIAGVGSSLQEPSRYGLPTLGWHINFVVVAFWVIFALALIGIGWKLTQSKK